MPVLTDEEYNELLSTIYNLEKENSYLKEDKDELQKALNTERKDNKEALQEIAVLISKICSILHSMEIIDSVPTT